MTLDFVEENFIIGQKNPDIKPSLVFFRKGFRIGSGKITPDYKDIILSGNTALTLTNALADSLNYLKLFGGTEQTGTPTPDNPMDIVCNNGVVKVSKNLFDQSLFNTDVGANINYITYSIPNGTYTFSSPDFPLYSGTTSVFVLAGRVTGGASSGTNGVSSTTPRTITVTDGQYTVAYRSTISSMYVTPNPKDFNWQLELGSTATPYMPYGQIYVDGTTETVEITGKNLFDKNTTIIRSYIEGAASKFKPNLAANSFIIKVKPNTTYTLHSEVKDGTRMRCGLSDTYKVEGEIRIVRRGMTSETITFTTDSTEEYCYINLLDGSDRSAVQYIFDAVQLEEGSTATTYEPYTVLGTATAENLFKVDTYQDIQSVIDGGVTRNVGIKVLDGTENWTASATTGKFFISTAVVGWNAMANNATGYCTHAVFGKGSIPANGKVNFDMNSFCFYYSTTTTTLAELKQFLADQYANGTPVIIAYPLATATTETVTGQPMNIQAGTNIVQITQASIDNLGLEVSYKATV